MARTTPAQKPRGWASMTLIKTSRFGTGFLFDFGLSLRPAAARRPGAGIFRVIYVAIAACGSSANPFFSSLYLFRRSGSAAPRGSNAVIVQTTSRKTYALNPAFEPKIP